MVTVVDVDAGPRTVARRVEVAAPAVEVFAILANPRQHHELDGSGSIRDDVPVLGPERLSVGDTFTVALQQSGIPYQATSTVTSFEDGRVIEWADSYGRKWRWELTETPASTTEVTVSMDDSCAVTPLFDQLFGDDDRYASAITKTLRKLAHRFALDNDAIFPPRTLSPLCHARWHSPNLKAAG
ncbi:SRPBCC family protein [Mycolicibacterium mengxianglii]|uniref:SRPBCC family protein n=1 Tax=Mycolicibacterium mengxianglii TaxID=2736649 RepID=UPI0018D01896|nr:SRPBCC family protein [Mycolicibacterium mengxianglii]